MKKTSRSIKSQPTRLSSKKDQKGQYQPVKKAQEGAAVRDRIAHAKSDSSYKADFVGPNSNYIMREGKKTVARYPLTKEDKFQQELADSAAFANKQPLVNLFPKKREYGGKVVRVKPKRK